MNKKETNENKDFVSVGASGQTNLTKTSKTEVKDKVPWYRKKWVIAIIVFFLVGGFISALTDAGEKTKNKEEQTSVQKQEEQKEEPKETEKQEEKHGETGIEVVNKSEIEDFSYKTKKNKVLIESYDGKEEILSVKKSYKIKGKKYNTDLSDFQIDNRKVETIIFEDGIKKVNTSIFNSSEIKKVFFPKTMKVVYDYCLSYLHPDDGKTIKIYYAGTKKQWSKIFKKYKRKTVKEAWDSSGNSEKKAKEVGTSVADKLNNFFGMEYDSSDFEYFFSANEDDLK